MSDRVLAPSELIALLTCYISPDAPLPDSAQREVLIAHGLIVIYPDFSQWEVTDKGTCYIEHILQTPLPEQAWTIPNRPTAV